MPDANYAQTVPSPLGPEALHAAIQRATAALPQNKRVALIGGIQVENGKPDANAVIAVKIGTHWAFAGEAEYHADHSWKAGGEVAASW